MLSLEWPWLLLCLPLPWLIRRALSPLASPSVLYVPFAAQWLASANASDGAVRNSRVRQTLLWLSWFLLIVAAARPVWIGERIELPVSGRDLMLAVDLSGSMETADFRLEERKVDRLEAVKAVAGEFILRRQGDRLGLILFGRQAYLQTPLTFDRTTVAAMLKESVIGMAGKETAIGDAIGLAIKRLRERPQQSRVLILLTDGANTAGEMEPAQAARLAQEAGLKIYTIGVGADRMEVRTLFGSRLVNPSSDLDEGLLRQIAESTGGSYFRARDTEALEQIYTELDRLEPQSSDVDVFRPQSSLMHWLLTPCLFLLASLIWYGRAGGGAAHG